MWFIIIVTVLLVVSIAIAGYYSNFEDEDDL